MNIVNFFAFQSPVDRFLSISWPSILWYYDLKNIHEICYRSLIHILVIVKINDWPIYWFANGLLYNIIFCVTTKSHMIRNWKIHSVARITLALFTQGY